MKTPAEKEKVRGTVKGALLVGDPEVPDLVAILVYNTKPVNFMSMCCKTVQWVKKTFKVYDKKTNKSKNSTFLWLNINDLYNKEMGNVDIADQIRGAYRIDKWMRKYKWWYAIFWWGFQVLMVNSYVLYKSHMNKHGLKPLSHYEFNKFISRVYITGENASKKLKRERDNDASIGNSTSTSSIKKIRFTDSSLHPLTGELRGRCDHQSKRHWPKPCQKNDYCQLHHWVCTSVNKMQVYKNSVHCADCNVNLCSGYCFEKFHDTWDLVGEREDIEKKMLNDMKVDTKK